MKFWWIPRWWIKRQMIKDFVTLGIPENEARKKIEEVLSQIPPGHVIEEYDLKRKLD